MVFSKRLAYLTLGKICQVFISIATIKVITQNFDKDEVGQYYLLLTLLAFFNFLFFNHIGQYYNRFVIYFRERKELASISFLMFIIRIFLALLSLSFACAGYFLFDWAEYFELKDFLLLIFFSLVSSVSLVFLNALNIVGDSLVFAKITVATLIFGFLCSLTFISLWHNPIYWLFGVAVSQFLSLFFIYKYLVKGERLSKIAIFRRFNRAHFKKALVFCFPVMITLFLQWGQNSGYRLLIESKYTVSILGAIAVGMALSSSIFTAIESITNQIFLPSYTQKITSGDQFERAEAWNLVAKKIIPIYVSLLMFVIGMSPFIANVLVSSDFRDIYIFAVVGAFFEFFRVISNLIYLVSQSELNTKVTIIPYVIGLFLSSFCITFFDFSGKEFLIVIVLAFAYLYICFHFYFIMKRLLCIKLPFTDGFFSLLLSSPLLLGLLIDKSMSFFSSFTLVVFFGMYWLLVNYYIFLMSNGKLKRG